RGEPDAQPQSGIHGSDVSRARNRVGETHQAPDERRLRARDEKAATASELPGDAPACAAARASGQRATGVQTAQPGNRANRQSLRNVAHAKAQSRKATSSAT